MNDYKYNFSVVDFNIAQKPDLPVLLKNLQPNDSINIRADYFIADIPFFKIIPLFYNDTIGKNEEQVYEFLKDIIEGDKDAICHTFTVVGYGTLVDNIARNLSEKLNVNLIENEEEDIHYGERDFFYDSSGISKILMWKPNQSILERVIIFDWSELKDKTIINSFPLLVNEIEKEMTEQIQKWLNQSSQ